MQCSTSSSIYASVGSVDAGADVVLICRDPIDSNYVYAGYAINVGEAADAKRGYIPVSAVNVSVTDVNKLPARSANGRACRCTSKLTVINKPVGGSASVGSISANESFTRFDETDNAYTYVEYSTSSKTKRGFVLTSSLSSGVNTGRTGVVAENCDVYHGPDLDGYAKVGSVDAGEVVAVLEYETPISADKWLMIEYNTTSGRKRGYVPRHYISITSFSGVNVMRKIQSIATFAGTASAKAYYGPNTTFPSVGSIGAGELVSLIDQWDTNGSYRLDGVITKIKNAMQHALAKIQRTLMQPEVKQFGKEQVKKKAKESIMDMLAKAKINADRDNRERWEREGRIAPTKKHDMEL